ncbi:uncharacterized protein B0H18DRAFT_961810 [Fomitopsis serialis]|uniref:uncharacterized protein n=1 Tax=Fomitopsis serialis TaxID=139415 RepID=UPI0020081224|nr:uncharacterized protein B0H18DRAFT_961810 [Neoantrodia serialis]KAH9911750.1 hypothetical protein B0H18DRAFT_961810 [Neoantrodia serialis]
MIGRALKAGRLAWVTKVFFLMEPQPLEGDDYIPTAAHHLLWSGINPTLITENHRPHPAPLPPRTPAPALPTPRAGPSHDVAPHMDVRHDQPLESWLPRARPYPPPAAAAAPFRVPTNAPNLPARPHTSTARGRPLATGRLSAVPRMFAPRAVSNIAAPLRMNTPRVEQVRTRTPQVGQARPPPAQENDVFWHHAEPPAPPRHIRTPAPLFQQPQEPEILWRTPLTRTAFEPERAVGRMPAAGGFVFPPNFQAEPDLILNALPPPPPSRGSRNATPGPAIPRHLAAPVPRRPPTFEPQDVEMEDLYQNEQYLPVGMPPQPLPVDAHPIRQNPINQHDGRHEHAAPQPAFNGPRAPTLLPAHPMSLPGETPAPSGGWRVIAGGFDPSWKVTNVARTQVDDWTERNRPAVFLQIPNRGTLDAGGYECRLAMEDALKRMGVAKPEIEFPTPENEEVGENAPPHWCVAFGPTTQQCSDLVAKRWVSTNDTTFAIVEFSFDTSHFVGFWQNLEYFDDASLPGMRHAFRNAILFLYQHGDLKNVILRDIGTLGRWHGQTPAYVIDYILQSVQVDLLECRGPRSRRNTLVRLYCEPPTSSLSEWLAFRKALSECRLNRPGAKTPVYVEKTFKCRYCHCVDHPTGLCYLNDVPLWHGPERTPDEPTATEQAQPNRNNASRGRGETGGRGGKNMGHHRGGNGGKGRGNRR